MPLLLNSCQPHRSRRPVRATLALAWLPLVFTLLSMLPGLGRAGTITLVGSSQNSSSSVTTASWLSSSSSSWYFSSSPSYHLATGGTTLFSSGSVLIIDRPAGGGPGGIEDPEAEDFFFGEERPPIFSLPRQPDPGQPLVIDAVENEPLEMQALFVTATGGQHRYSSTTGPHSALYPYRPSGEVRLEWSWNGRVIPDMAAWLKNGSDGKWGTYTVRMWEAATDWYKKPAGTTPMRYIGYGTPLAAPNYPGMPLYSDGWYRHDRTRFVGSLTFEVRMRDKTPLAAGTPPVFELQPEAEIVRTPSGHSATLVVRANAGEPFEYRWFREGPAIYGREAVAGNGPSITVDPSQLTETGFRFFCEAYNSSGTAVSTKSLVRLARRPLLRTAGMPGLFAAGGDLALRPLVESDTPCQFTWSGPGVSDGTARATVAADGALRIANARLTDGGLYTVKVTNAEAQSEVSIDVAVVEFPEPVLPLRPDTMLWLNYAGTPIHYQAIWRHPYATTRPQTFSPEKTFIQQGNRWALKKSTPDMAGEYVCTVSHTAKRDGDMVNWVGRYVRESHSYLHELRYRVKVIVPNERAELPEETSLPPGRVRVPYDYQPPVPANAAVVGTRFAYSGLPRGLKVNTATGRITGTPEQGGEFQVKLTVSNAKGAGATRTLPLSIDALDGAVGAFVLYWNTPYGGGMRCDLTVTASGAYTLKGLAKPAKGLLEVDAGTGQVRLVHPEIEVLFDRAQDRLTGNSGGFPLAGWRQTWSRLRPATAYVGRYHFDTAVSALPAGLTNVAQGTQHGACVVSATGGTVVTYFNDTGAPSVTTAFLGPEGEALMMPRQPHGYGATVLQIAAAAGSITGTAAPVSAHAYGPRDFTIGLHPAYVYYQGAWQRSGLGTPVPPAAQPLTHTFAGGRYTPPKAGVQLPGYGTDTTNARFDADVEGISPQIMLFVRLAPTGSITLPMPGDTHFATLRLNRTTGELTGTVRLRAPLLNTRTQTLTWKEQLLPLHAFLVPSQNTADNTAGYRIAGLVRTPLWWTVVNGESFTWPLTSIPVTLIPNSYVTGPGPGPGFPGGIIGAGPPTPGPAYGPATPGAPDYWDP